MRKISILTFDLSDNSTGRAYILAKALSRHYEVEIIGPSSKGQLWKPLLNDKTLRYKFLTHMNMWFPHKMPQGDLIYAVKPKGTSYGYALWCKLILQKKIILDIDDWEIGSYKDFRLIGKLYSICRFWDLNNYTSTWLLDKLTGLADAITVSNSFLQDKYQGILVPHFRNTDQFDPNRFEARSLRKRLNLEDQKIILFLGTIRRHKGVNQLIRGVELLHRADTTLLLVGAGEKDKSMLPRYPFLKVLGFQPFEDIPKFLAIADLVVIFQSYSHASQGQLPAKVFDAMSMARPIIASRISDLPKVLEECGEVVEPDNVEELARKMEYILSHPQYAKKLGQKARQKCIENYSEETMSHRLHQLVETVFETRDVNTKNR